MGYYTGYWVKIPAVNAHNQIVRLFIALGAMLLASGAGAQQIHWFNDYSSAMMEARKTGKPIFLAFRCSP